MKKIIFIATLLAGGSVFAQHPQALDHLKKTYPKAEDIYWDDYEDFTEASFTEGDISKVAHYTLSGQWIETSYDVDTEEIPAKIKSSLTAQTSIDNVSIISFIEGPNGSKKYSIDVETDDASFTLIYDTEGNLIKKINNQDEF